MAKAKNKPSDETMKPELFNEEPPIQTGQVKVQIEVEQKAEPDPLKKRTRNKKSTNPPLPAKELDTQSIEQPPASIVSLTREEPQVLQLLPDPKLIEEREAQLKEKYKQQKEDRLAALKRVRGNK